MGLLENRPQTFQAPLGPALKQSFKAGNAKEAKGCVAELNQTYANIISEVEGQVAARVGEYTEVTAAVLTLALSVPWYHRTYFFG